MAAAVTVVPVLDVRRGRCVHATGGEREAYRSLSRSFDVPEAPAETASWLLERYGPRPLYLADLDALAGDKVQRGVIRDVASVAESLWVDGGVATLEAALTVSEDGAEVVIVALETLPSWGLLEEVAAALGSAGTAFGLDLEAGRPVTGVGDGGGRPPGSPADMVARALRAGAGRVVAVDLARVGGRDGPDLPQVRRLRKAAGGARLAVGGGVGGAGDVGTVGSAGADECLVATALYDGTLTPGELGEIEDA